MGLQEAISFVQGASELVGALQSEVRNSNSNARREAESLQALLDVLREIYFAPGGTRAVLELLAEGKQPSEALTSAILPPFNDFEYRWRRRERLIDFENTAAPTLGFHARETLHRIMVGKGGLRTKVQELLNEPLTLGGEVSSVQASELLEEIQNLNGEIADAEEMIMNLMKELS